MKHTTILHGILKNCLAGAGSQIIKILFLFVTRSLFIHYIGKELLGLNSTFASIINTLSLTELGFQTAVAFSLYKPLHEDNYTRINDILCVLKVFYRGIGIFFIIASIALLPFLNNLINGITVTKTVWVYFLLQMAASASSYFLAYKRTLLFADKKEYVANCIDMLCTIFFNSILCLTLITLKSYVIYLLIKLVHTITSNVIIHLYCRKKYAYLEATSFSKSEFHNIFSKVKHVIPAKIAGYIYGSTDNIIISAFVSTVSVGSLVNYTTVTTSLRTLTNSLLNSMTPIIGTMLIEKKTNSRKHYFDLYTHIMMLVSICVVIPLFLLFDDFILWWIKDDTMLLKKSVSLLIAIDFYIHLVHGSLREFINGGGLFKQEKYIDIAGAASNIILSFVFVRLWGIFGVLFATVISQMIFWVGRSMIVFQCYFKDERKAFLRYWLKNLKNAVITLLLYAVCHGFYHYILAGHSSLITLLLGAMGCEIIIVILFCLAYYNTPEQKQLIHGIWKYVKKQIQKTI